MSSRPSICDKETVRRAALELGFCAVGFTDASPIAAADVEAYDRWLAAGRHASMAYLERYADVRANPALLLEGAQTVVCCAVSYDFGVRSPYMASYAMGADYHEVVRDMLSALGRQVESFTGCRWRACVDTAPVRERLLGVRAGIGFIGRNRQLIVPGVGSRVFLGELVLTARFEPDEPCRVSCAGCGRCVTACPGGALTPDGGLDARRCLSYLTIEHRGSFPPDAPSTGCHLYGCDVCQDVCPHCQGAASATVDALLPRTEVAALTPADAARLTPEEFARLFRRSAVKRTKLEGLLRNARAALDVKENHTNA